MKKPAFKPSDHHDGKKFVNPSGAINKSFREFWRWQRSGQRAEWPTQVENKGTPEVRNQTSADEVYLTFINHITFLIQTNGLNFLTDPVFSLRVSPSQRIGPKRVRKPGLALNALPKIDVVLISHNHYDHMDLAALLALQERFQPLFLTPLGNRSILQKAGLRRVTENDWWDTHLLGDGTEVITTPAQHWSGRGLLDRNQALWSGFVVRTPKRQLFFAGDTGYADHFQQIRQRLGPIDLALLPIGAYAPRWFMKDQHMNPEDAVRAHLDLQARASIGTHFGTFQLTDEAIDAPLIELGEAVKKYAVDTFQVLEVGETRRF